jgi:hypothetical protein
VTTYTMQSRVHSPMKYYWYYYQLILVVNMMAIKAFRSQPSVLKISTVQISRSLTSNSFVVSKLLERSSSNKRQLFTMKYDETAPNKIPKRVRNNRGTGNTAGEDLQQKEQAVSDGVRLNKCLIGLSRRGADDAISEGRVTINNIVATNGIKVKKRDVVRLVSWSSAHQLYKIS